MQPSTIRSFFACEISEENLSGIDRLIANLKAASPKPVKWVNSGNIHLTIKFIGEFKSSDLDAVHIAMDKALANFHPFDLGIRGMGIFPSLSKPKVIWLGIQTDDSLNNLVKIINSETEKLGYATEKRPFSAHITLGRVKSYASPDELKGISSIVNSKKDIEIGSQSVNELLFIRSTLTPAGPVYQVMHKYTFSG